MVQYNTTSRGSICMKFHMTYSVPAAVVDALALHTHPQQDDYCPIVTHGLAPQGEPSHRRSVEVKSCPAMLRPLAPRIKKTSEKHFLVLLQIGSCLMYISLHHGLDLIHRG